MYAHTLPEKYFPHLQRSIPRTFQKLIPSQLFLTVRHQPQDRGLTNPQRPSLPSRRTCGPHRTARGSPSAGGPYTSSTTTPDTPWNTAGGVIRKSASWLRALKRELLCLIGCLGPIRHSSTLGATSCICIL